LDKKDKTFTISAILIIVIGSIFSYVVFPFELFVVWVITESIAFVTLSLYYLLEIIGKRKLKTLNKKEE